MEEGTRPTGGWREPSTLLIVAGVVLVFVSFVLVVVRAASAMYVMMGGVAVLILGFVVSSRSR